MIPPKLKKGDTLRVIAPSLNMRIISEESHAIAKERFLALGLSFTFGTHVDESDMFGSSAVASRVADMHAAFSDPSVAGILTVIGGFNANQLLSHLDYDVIGANPKIFCGFSDITVLQNAIYAKTGLVTYSGPHYSSFAMRLGFEYTLDYFCKCLFQTEKFPVVPSFKWSDDPWYRDQNKREFLTHPGYAVIQEGKAEGGIVGGNLCTFQLLHGTEFMPSLKNTILFLEEDETHGQQTDVFLDRIFQSILHQPGAEGIRGIVIGRFQKKSQITPEKLHAIIRNKPQLHGIPVVANVDFGHTSPMITFPIGGTAHLSAIGTSVELVIEQH